MVLAIELAAWVAWCGILLGAWLLIEPSFGDWAGRAAQTANGYGLALLAIFGLQMSALVATIMAMIYANKFAQSFAA